MNGVYENLQAVFEGKTSITPEKFKSDFEKAVERRLELCKGVAELLKGKDGERNVVLNVVENTVEKGWDAIAQLLQLQTEADTFKRRTIVTQLKSAILDDAEQVGKNQ